MNQNPEVDAYMAAKSHPLEKEINRVRTIVLESDLRIGEVIKWSSPTFIYKGNMASFFMNAKKNVSLMFHKGALLDDPHGVLDGDGKEGRVMRFKNMEDIEFKKDGLQAVVQSWIRLQDHQIK